ncbi:hypothetical protein EWM63_28045 [Pseudoduganella lutea]|uniref:Uncharacterized protein n=1 Tax=Pseudoduganella lutea TaxID=321985 RepID=A0A4P6L662_9BURK|nr:hypothetical protein EWM63_28045 [Pseudoduganella lutea]
MANYLAMPYANVKALVRQGRVEDLFTGFYRGYDPARLADITDHRIACTTLARRIAAYARIVAYVHDRVTSTPGLTLDAALLTPQDQFVYAAKDSAGLISLSCGNPAHPVWTVDAGYLMRTQRWCGHCAKSVKKTDNQVEMELGIRGFALLSDYRNANAEITVKCTNGHVVTHTLSKIVNGNVGCPQCFSPREEAVVQHYLEYFLGIRFDQVRKRPAWLYELSGQRLELDGYCTEWKLAFEYQGEHHYKTVGYAIGSALSAVQARDAAKSAACKAAGVLLIVVPTLPKRWNEQIAADHVAQCLVSQGFGLRRKACDAPKFIKREPEKLSVFRTAIEAAEGALLEEVYKGYHRGHLIRCAFGHEWLGTPASIFRGCWCPKCARQKSVAGSKRERAKRYESSKPARLQQLREIVEAAGGTLLEAEYKGLRSPHAVTCGKCGHAWSPTAQSLFAGHFCQRCGRDNLIAAAKRATTKRSIRKFHRAKAAVKLLAITTPNEVARFLGLSAHTVRRYARKAAEQVTIDLLEDEPAPFNE